MKTIFRDILKRIGDAEIPENYPRIRKNNRLFEYVDIDWGQCDYFDAHPVKYPCALVDLAGATYGNEGDLKQTGVVTVQVRIIDLVSNNSSYLAPERQKNIALAVFDLMSETNRLLHGWGQDVNESEAGYGRLVKQGIAKVNRRDGLREYRLLYRVQLTDATAMPKRGATTVKPVIMMRAATVGD